MDRRVKLRKLLDLAGAGLIALVLGAALSMVLSDAFSLAASFKQVLLTCAVTALVMMVSGWGRGGRALSLALAGALLLYLALPPVSLFGQLSGMFGALVEMGSGEELPLSQYGPLIGMVMGALLTLVLYWMAQMSGGVYPALTLSVMLMMGGWFLSNQLSPLYTMMAVSALAAMFARASDEKITYLRAVPAAVLAAALAMAMVPAGNLTWQPLRDAAQKARELFNDYFLFTEPRTTYSISADGFQSRGEMLGGPAEPSMSQVMLVETDHVLLMRGSVKRTYTTYSWTENAVNSRYVFIDPTRRAVRDQVFDSTRLDGLDISGAFQQVEAQVTMLSPGISTLFVPHRITDFSAPLDLVTYFSSSGEVFITRGVEPGDAYQVTALVPTGDVAATDSLLQQAAARGDDGSYEQALASYTTLPQGIDQRVYQLAQQLAQDQPTPYRKALAIQDYLMNNFTYTLEVEYPPQGQDFVSYFLLDSQQGYCSYFASAMAVMARMVGLPSRYIEGYLVPVRDGGATVVTGKNAHAWVEIYFEGAGWVSFNPTPGSGDTYQPPSGGGQDEGTDQEKGQTPDQGGAQPTPEPTPEPTNQPGQGDIMDDAAQDETEQEEPQEEPQEELEEEPEESPQQEPEEEPQEDPWEDEQQPPNRWWLWLLLLVPLAALAYWVVQRLRRSDPRRLTAGRGAAADKLAIWYRALLLALEQQGQVPGPGETPLAFAQRLKEAGLAEDSLVEVARQISLNRYAGQKVEVGTLAQARAAYAQLTSQLKPLERMRWLGQRIFRGLGSFVRIP